MKLQAAARLKATEVDASIPSKLYHGTNSDLPVGEIITSKGSNQRMGAVEGVFEWARAQLGIGVSRLHCVFMTPEVKYARDYGDNVYQVEPEGKHAEGHSSWIHVLMDVLEKDGCYKRGVIKRKPKNATLPIIEKVVRWYFTGKRIDAAQAKELGVSVHRYDSHTYIYEVLATKVKIVSKV